jgi:hypothetical protein
MIVTIWRSERERKGCSKSLCFGRSGREKRNMVARALGSLGVKARQGPLETTLEFMEPSTHSIFENRFMHRPFEGGKLMLGSVCR